MSASYIELATSDGVQQLSRESREWNDTGATYAELTLSIHENVVRTHQLICDYPDYAREWSKSPDTFSDDQVQRAVMTLLVKSILGWHSKDALIDFLLKAPRIEDEDDEYSLSDYLFSSEGRRLMVMYPFIR